MKISRVVVLTVLSIALPCLAQKPPAPAPKPAAAAPVDPWKDKPDLFGVPSIPPTTKVDLGAVQRFVMPNGIKVIAVPRPSVPAVSVTLVVKVGNLAAPLDRAGLAQFTANMLRKGTQKRTSDQIATAIDFVGGDLDGSADDDGTYVSCQARTKDLALCMDLLSDVVQRPTFPEGEMNEIREQLVSMSKRTLTAIDRAALVAFHKSWFAPNNAMMVISGDIDAKTIKTTLAKWFGGWKKHDVPKTAVHGLPAVQEWMRHASEAGHRIMRDHSNATGEEKLRLITEYNVLAQIENLRSHPSVDARVLREEVEIRGWVYDIGEGSIWAADPESGRFNKVGATKPE